VLASRDGKIVCENTLDARLDVVFRKKLPEVLHFGLHKYIETALHKLPLLFYLVVTCLMDFDIISSHSA
jgi:hypothetical protein